MRETLEFVALLDRAEEPAKNFSGGMKHRRNRNKEGELDELRVLIVDDTSLYRMIVTHALQDVEDVETVGSAPNGKSAMSRGKRGSTRKRSIQARRISLLAASR